MLLRVFLSMFGAAVGAPAQAQTQMVDVGFQAPEAARYDAEDDIYLVSNLGPRGDGNDGFISRVRPGGQIEDLEWIKAGENGVELYEPLGIFLHDNLLLVADSTAVRRFDLDTGAPLPALPAPGARRLNDLTVAADGTIYITDSGAENEPGALYRVVPGASEAEIFVERSGALARPNGIAITREGLIVHGGLDNDRLVFRESSGEISRERILPTGRIDGIVALEDGGLLVASQEGGSIYHVDSDGSAPVEVVSGIAVPAAIGFDSRRSRILIPQIAAESLTIADLPDRQN